MSIEKDTKQSTAKVKILSVEGDYLTKDTFAPGIRVKKFQTDEGVWFSVLNLVGTSGRYKRAVEHE